MDESGLAAVAKFVMRDKQNLGALRVRDGVITLEQLYFADEIRPVKEIKPPKRQVDKPELDMALRLIESFKSEWDPKQYKDTYRDELMKVIEAKRKGREVHVGAEPEEKEEAPDLLTALRESVERSKGGAKRGKRTQARKRTQAKKRTQTRRAA
jgi:DNA end-binding protein Ku